MSEETRTLTRQFDEITIALVLAGSASDVDDNLQSQLLERGFFFKLGRQIEERNRCPTCHTIRNADPVSKGT